MKYILMTALAVLTPVSALAQTQDTQLTVKVLSLDGDDLTGQEVKVRQTDWEVSYGTLKLDASGTVSLKAYPGNHTVTVDREGFNHGEVAFNIAEGEDFRTVTVELTEKTREPFALKAASTHDVFTGRDDIEFSWNVEAPAFFDDFEGYEPFAVEFGEWTGIDGDMANTASLVGTYPNRGTLQYAQIINPLTVSPPWWYEYPVLRPCSGQQYAGFVRTNTGVANDDWLISPVIVPGTDNILAFKAKAADQWEEPFMVYITTETESPSPADFVRLDEGNRESVHYKWWQDFQYDLSGYAGRPVKIAIRYIGDAGKNGAFMLMVDDFFVGHPDALAEPEENAEAKCRRSPERSRYNPFEKFNIYLDGTQIGTTGKYTFTVSDVAPGEHTLGVEAVYRNARSGLVTLQTQIPDIKYANVEFRVEARSILEADEIGISLVSLESGNECKVTTSGGEAKIPSLAPGKYSISVNAAPYEEYIEEIDVTGDMTCAIGLEDKAVAPVNITVDETGEGEYVARWNRDLSAVDSFEDYEDFATGEFGGWKTLDRDGMPVYPIGLGSQDNIVTFPGSGDAVSPKAIAPMVFNPWNTVPAMLPTDNAIAAPTGDKTVIFFSPQMAQADKWLISPVYPVRKGYEMSLKAKAYTIYPETLEFMISDGGDNPEDFRLMAESGSMPSSGWTEYSVPLDEFLETEYTQNVRFAVHYTSYDAFIAQVDDFTVGPAGGYSDMEDLGNVDHYNVYLDGEDAGHPNSPDLALGKLTEGEHTLGVETVYKYKTSELVEYKFNVVSGIVELEGDGQEASIEWYDTMGKKADRNSSGVLIGRSTTGKTYKKVTK